MAEAASGIGELLSTLAAWLGIGAGEIASNIPQWVSDGLDALSGAISGLWGLLDGAWEWLKTLLDNLWWEVIIPAIEKIQQIIDDITTWLANLLDPLLQWITKIAAWIQKYIVAPLKIIEDILQTLRVMLGALSLLGVKWAQKLDADIQQLQSWITEIIQTIVGTLNQISTIIGLVIDPAQIVRRDFMANSLFGSLAGVKRAAGFGTDRISTPSENTLQQNSAALATGMGQNVNINPDGTVSYAAGYAKMSQDVDVGRAALGLPVAAT